VRALAAALLALALAAAGPAAGREREARANGDARALEAHVRRLASAELGGRLAGSAGERLAADYLAERLAALGAQPLPGHALRIPFEFAAGTRDAGSSLAVSLGDRRELFRGPDHVRALSFSSNETVSGTAVFAGYGLVVPEALGAPYDSYAGLDVEGKLVVVLRYFPEDLEVERRAALSRYAGLRYKALAARERGARALVVVNGPRSPHAGELVPMSFDSAVSGSGIAAASVSGEVAERLFRDLPQGSLAEIQRSLDDGNPHVRGFPLGRELTLDARVERERRQGINVVGRLPGSAPDGRAVLLGAHYDHLGTGEHGSSLAREDERGELHPGADDNASGVAALLAIAAELAAERPPRDAVFAFWSGEELGVLGSADFVARALLPPEQIAAYLNFDMVGRARGNRLVLQGVGSSAPWPELIERANAPVGFELQLQQDPHVPTDSSVFDAARVPTLNFFTGAHADYHRPGDRPERVNYADLARVARLGARLARALAEGGETLAFVEVAPSREAGLGRGVLRAFTGTVPDYTAEVDGLALADVVPGGPAEQAGLRAGDVVVRFGAQRIANIYDYTYALEAARIGEPVSVRYLRGGEPRETTLTPEARP
jgi:hypothetical protein